MNTQENEMSMLALANVEALASSEGGKKGDACNTGSYNSYNPKALKCAAGCKAYDHVAGRVDKCS